MVILFILCTCALSAMAQSKPQIGLSTPVQTNQGKMGPEIFLAEKIYVQLDNKIYTTDQTVWFKAVVTLASDHSNTMISGVLHVDLIDQNEQIVEKKLIRLIGGIGDGFFQLNSNYTEGVYQVRAYTEWNRNFGSDFFFKEYIQVYPTGKVAEPTPITDITLAGSESQRRIKASINPLTIDSLHSRGLTVFIAADDKYDTVKLSRSSKDSYLLDYAVPQGANFVTLKLSTKNNSSFSRTVVLDENFLDLQFFPESGELVHGVSNLLGFKALDSSGKGLQVSGEILNSRDQVLTTFTSNVLGMGSVLLTNVDSTERYSARITQPKDRGQLRHALPAVAGRGNILSVKKMRDRIYLKAISNYLADDSVIVHASCRGQAQFDFKGRLQNGQWEFILPLHMFPEGVIAFTFMTSSRKPLAERLYFNERAENGVQLALSSDKDTYVQRELTKLDINATDFQGENLDSASLSVMVINKSDMGNLQSQRENILSYFLLSSDLRGKIESPGYYFTANESRYQDLDALLLTQGWSKYKYNRAPDKITVKPEPNLAITGYVGGLLAQKREQAGVGLSMLILGDNPGAQTNTTDSLGRFRFDIDEQEGHTINFLIQSNTKTGKRKDYSIIVDKPKSPDISFDPILTIQKPDSVERAYVSKSINRKKAEDTYIQSTEGIALQEVVVTETALSPEKKKVEEKYGKAKTVISGEDIRAKEEKWSYGLYSVLMFQFPQVRVRQYPGGLYAYIPNGELTLVVVDGIPVMWENYAQISFIPPSEVKSFELIPYAKNFRSLFCETVSDCPITAPTIGNVIAIYTYGGKGIFGVRPPVGLSRYTAPVFAISREFYAPKYERLTKDDWKKPDGRTLIHWQPRIRTDNQGKATVSFYNADNVGTQSVIVEAITPDGKVGYKELSFEVRK